MKYVVYFIMMKPQTKYAVFKRPLTQQIYECIRNNIISGTFKPNERLDLQQLAAEMGASITPVREALQKLVEVGLVENKPYKGYFVIGFTSEDIKELFDVRIALEITALRHVFSELHKTNLTSYFVRLQRLKSLTRQKYIEQTQQFDRDFHLGLILGRTRWFKKYIDGIFDLISFTTQLSINPDAAYEEHYAVLKAITEGNVEEACMKLEMHLRRAQADALCAFNKKLSKGGDQKKEEKERRGR